MTVPTQWTRNSLLATFRPEDFDRLESGFDSVPLIPGSVVQDIGTAMTHVYFVESGALSVLAGTDGATVEVGLVGREGLFGVPAVLGAETAPHRGLVQASGSAFRLSVADLRRVMDDNAHFRRVLLRFVEVFLVQAAQAAVCNARHTLSERLAKWLLMLQDRTSEPMPVTHDLLSRMLGVRRSGVTLALGALERAGIVRQGRGLVTVLDRAMLEGAACACYGVVTDEYRRLSAGPAGGLRNGPGRDAGPG